MRGGDTVKVDVEGGGQKRDSVVRAEFVLVIGRRPRDRLVPYTVLSRLPKKDQRRQ